MSLQASQLLTAEELAVRWQIPKSHVYRLARDGRLPVVALGRYKRFTLAAIEHFETIGGTTDDTRTTTGRTAA